MLVTAATEEDAEPILGVLERAMADDPFVAWLARPGSVRARRSYVGLMLERIALPKGRVWVAREGATIVGAALWAPPHTFELGAGESLRILPLMLDVIGLTRMSRVAAALEAIDRARPPEPRWLLTVVGVDPARRGEGIGRAVLAPGLDHAVDEGAPVVAETANPANLPFYARLGFAITHERALGEGTTSWTLVRDPSAGMLAEGPR